MTKFHQREPGGPISRPVHKMTDREALAALVSKLEECAPDIDDAFLHRQLRCGDYTGPNYAKELADAREVLAMEENRDA